MKSCLLPWTNSLLRHTDAGLGWDLDVRLFIVSLAAGIHDNYWDCLVLHHMKKFFSCDPTNWLCGYKTKTLNQWILQNCFKFSINPDLLEHVGYRFAAWLNDFYQYLKHSYTRLSEFFCVIKVTFCNHTLQLILLSFYLTNTKTCMSLTHTTIWLNSI